MLFSGSLRKSLLLSAVLLLAGCAQQVQTPAHEIGIGEARAAPGAPAVQEVVPEPGGATVYSATPPIRIEAPEAGAAADEIPAGLTGAPLRVSYDNVPLARFIDDLFAKRLGL